MKKLLHAGLAVLFVALSQAPAFASEPGSMFCHGGIISTGDTVGEVLAKCGQPTYATQREEKRVYGGYWRGAERLITTVAIDDWLYNFGPNRFQYRLVLENGFVRKIESLEYGY
jgi:hypothetical protein